MTDFYSRQSKIIVRDISNQESDQRCGTGDGRERDDQAGGVRPSIVVISLFARSIQSSVEIKSTSQFRIGRFRHLVLDGFSSARIFGLRSQT